MSIASNRSGLGLLLPALFNPTVAAALGLGVLGVGLYRLLADEENEVGGGELTVSMDKSARHSEEERENIVISFQETDLEPLSENERTVSEEVAKSSISEDELGRRKEIIRQAMSELGKRSAAARAARRIGEEK